MYKIKDLKIADIIDEAIRLLDYDNKNDGNSFIVTIKAIVKRILVNIGVREDNYYLTWRTGILAKSLLLISSDYDNRSEIIDIIKLYFTQYYRKGSKIEKIDNIQNGEACLNLYMITCDSQYRLLAEKYMHYILHVRTDIEGSIPFLDNEYVFVDGLMICPFLLQYARQISYDRAIYNKGLDQFLNFIKHGIDEDLGLPYHGYCLSENLQYGIAGWGRGVGWFLYSIAASVDYMDLSQMKEKSIISAFKNVLDKSISYQTEEGLFNWCLLTKKGPIDTSATAMILYAIAKAVNIGLLNEGYKQHVIVGYQSLNKYVQHGKVKQAMGDCMGFSMYPQFKYDSYPWSVAFYLLLTYEINKFNQE